MCVCILWKLLPLNMKYYQFQFTEYHYGIIRRAIVLRTAKINSGKLLKFPKVYSASIPNDKRCRSGLFIRKVTSRGWCITLPPSLVLLSSGKRGDSPVLHPPSPLLFPGSPTSALVGCPGTGGLYATASAYLCVNPSDVSPILYSTLFLQITFFSPWGVSSNLIYNIFLSIAGGDLFLVYSFKCCKSVWEIFEDARDEVGVI